MTVKVVFKPSLKEVRARYEKLSKEVRNFRGLYAKVAVWLDTWVQRNFRMSGGKVGGWEPLAAGGRRIKKGKKTFLDETAKVLIDSSRLRHSFLPFADSKKAGVGSDLPYAKTHNEGIKVPERQIVPKKIDVINDLLKISELHAGKKIKRSKL